MSKWTLKRHFFPITYFEPLLGGKLACGQGKALARVTASCVCFPKRGMVNAGMFANAVLSLELIDFFKN